MLELRLSRSLQQPLHATRAHFQLLTLISCGTRTPPQCRGLTPTRHVLKALRGLWCFNVAGAVGLNGAEAATRIQQVVWVHIQRTEENSGTGSWETGCRGLSFCSRTRWMDSEMSLFKRASSL